jgi:hypothetical protein
MWAAPASESAFAGYAFRNCMETFEVKLLQYSFRFRQLSWREELGMLFPEKVDRRRTLLAHALSEISGLKVNTTEEGMKVMDALPISVVHRVFILYRAAQPEPRVFTTTGLYRADEPNAFHARIARAEEDSEKIMDRVEQEMAQKFGRKELEEQVELEREMLRNSKGIGLTKASADRPTEPDETSRSRPVPVAVPPKPRNERPWTNRKK